jgi:uncharacterized protein (TIGR00251 family)
MLEEAKKQLKEKGSVYLKIKAIPGSAKTEIKTVMADGTIKISVAAAPERGRANIELLRFLSEEFGVAKGFLALVAGASDRIKLIKIKK